MSLTKRYAESVDFFEEQDDDQPEPDYCISCLKIDTRTPAVIDGLCAECAEEQRQSLYNSGCPLYGRI